MRPSHTIAPTVWKTETWRRILRPGQSYLAACLANTDDKNDDKYRELNIYGGAARDCGV